VTQASQRQLILAELADRLAGITQSEGYNTDAGLNIVVGETPELTKDDPPDALAIIIGDDVKTKDGQRVFLVLPIEFQAVVRVDVANAWLRVEACWLISSGPSKSRGARCCTTSSSIAMSPVRLRVRPVVRWPAAASRTS
jgi:hypothetical protein